jgi:hypothetical protein
LQSNGAGVMRKTGIGNSAPRLASIEDMLNG